LLNFAALRLKPAYRARGTDRRASGGADRSSPAAPGGAGGRGSCGGAGRTTPLGRSLEIAGPVTLRLWIAADALDTAFTTKLIDPYPPSSDDPRGFAMNLTEGLLRVRYRDSSAFGHR
jgi:hypothetical protein